MSLMYAIVFYLLVVKKKLKTIQQIYVLVNIVKNFDLLKTRKKNHFISLQDT